MSIGQVVTFGFLGSDGTEYIPGLGFLPADGVVGGPYFIAAAMGFSPGAIAAQAHTPGAVAGKAHVPGAIAAQGVPS